MSVKQASRQLVERTAITTMPVTTIWNKIVPSKDGFFVWTLYRNKLPTHERLKARGAMLVSRCQFCKEHETCHHFSGNAVILNKWSAPYIIYDQARSIYLSSS